MTRGQAVSRRGVYHDLNLSPYVYTSPYGDIFRFSSKKKMEIYTRDIIKEVDRLDKVIDRNGLRDQIPGEIVHFIFHELYKCFYRVVEG